jgi:hypothetical protein
MWPELEQLHREITKVLPIILNPIISKSAKIKLYDDQDDPCLQVGAITISRQSINANSWNVDATGPDGELIPIASFLSTEFEQAKGYFIKETIAWIYWIAQEIVVMESNPYEET